MSIRIKGPGESRKGYDSPAHFEAHPFWINSRVYVLISFDEGLKNAGLTRSDGARTGSSLGGGGGGE